MSNCTLTTATAALSALFLTASSAESPPGTCGSLTHMLEHLITSRRQAPVAAGNVTDNGVAILLTSQEATVDHEQRSRQTWSLLTAQFYTRGPYAGKTVGCLAHAGEDWITVPPGERDEADPAVAKASALVPHDTMVKLLRQSARQTLHAFAVDSNGYLVELFAAKSAKQRSPDNRGPYSALEDTANAGTFTIVVTDPYNYSSVFAAGRDWRHLPPVPQPGPNP